MHKVKKSVLLFLAFLVCSCAVSMTAHADGQAFNIEAEMLPSSENTYNVRLTVENTGEDWEGTVRMTVIGINGPDTDCVYDTAVTLPQGSTKQFTVSVPKESILYINREVRVALLDKNSEPDAFMVFENFFRINDEKTLTIGILSDDYAALTYLGGLKIDLYNYEYLVKLEKIDKDSLSDSLNTLDYLIVDTYDTGILTDNEINDIEQWTSDGGVLIVGTGSYAEDTLRGFSHLGIDCKEIYSPGENTQSYSSQLVDWQKLNMAELIDLGSQYYDNDPYGSLLLEKPEGDGAVGILPYSLSELGKLDESDYPYRYSNSDREFSDREFFVYIILYKMGMAAESLNSSSALYLYNKFDTSYNMRRLLGILGNSSNILNFGVLKFISIVYVIFAGPILYMILRFKRKNNLYWAAVPVAALVGIILIFFAGRGFETVNTRVYSVTVYNLSDKRDCRTYMHCYDAGHDEWILRLAEGYEYAGPKLNSVYSVPDYDKYYYHVIKEGERLFFGVKPASGFEDGYFCAGGTADAQKTSGSIDISQVQGELYDISGTVINNTGYDFEYFAVLEDESAQVYKGIPAGGTSSLPEAEILFFAESMLSQHDFSYITEAKKYAKTEDIDAIVALGVGIDLAYEQAAPDEIAVIGVVKDWDKAVDDDCSETSYACFYTLYK